MLNVIIHQRKYQPLHYWWLFWKYVQPKKKIFFFTYWKIFFNRLVMVFTWFKKVYLLKLEKKWLNMKFHQPLLLMDKKEILHLFDFGKIYFIIFFQLSTIYYSYYQIDIQSKSICTGQINNMYSLDIQMEFWGYINCIWKMMKFCLMVHFSNGH